MPGTTNGLRLHLTRTCLFERKFFLFSKSVKRINFNLKIFLAFTVPIIVFGSTGIYNNFIDLVAAKLFFQH